VIEHLRFSFLPKRKVPGASANPASPKFLNNEKQVCGTTKKVP
jgi:hypothetical protein